MKDREQNEYRVVMRRVSVGKSSFSSAVPGRFREIPMCLVSPARQAKKASGRAGRQWVKYRKAQRHIAKYDLSVGVRSAPDAQEPPTRGDA